MRLKQSTATRPWQCPTRWQQSFCATATPSINISPSARFATVGASSSWSYVGLWGSIRFFLFPLALPSGTWGFLLSLNHDWFTSQLQRAEFIWKGPLFRMFPFLLQSIISNQMRPRRLRGAWFSRLLQHPARRRSGSILSPGTYTGLFSAVRGCWINIQAEAKHLWIWKYPWIST